MILISESAIDQLIEKGEDPRWWAKIRDTLNNRDVILTDDQLQLLTRIRRGQYADPNFDETAVRLLR